MEIRYKSKKLKKQLTDHKELHKTFGLMARKVNQRLKELSDSDNLSIMGTIPAARCHELSGSRKGELAVNVSDNYRMIFIPANNPVPVKEDGGLNWEEITKIQIIEIEDYH